MQPLLETCDLTKTYKLGRNRIKTAVDRLNLSVPEGVVFGFLGPNGAGKTTTIKMLLDFARPTKGSATVFGRPTTDPSTRELIGYLPEQPYFPKFLKPVEVLSIHASLAGVKRSSVKPIALNCLKRTGIEEYAYTPISKLSKGLTQRVGIAQSIVGDPKMLILDEPTSGLDPIGRRHIRDLLLELKDEGKTIFLSSHLLSEVESTCDIVAVLKSGKLVACGSPEEVTNGNSVVNVETQRLAPEPREALKFLHVGVEQRAETTMLSVDPKQVYQVMRVLETHAVSIIRIDTKRESLEEAFLRLAA